MWNLQICYITQQKGLCIDAYVKDLEKGRSSQSTQAALWNYMQALEQEEAEREVRMMLYEEDSTYLC